ncbi:MAG: endonuclease MutS2 [Limnochordia bacterium]|jgi:DNA mismatch repair protein MutS2
MDERTLRVLEFHKIRERLAELCTCSLGRDLTGHHVPVNDIRTIKEWQQETSEAVNLLEACGNVPFGGLHDVRSALERARLGSMLDAEQFLEIVDTLRATRRLRAFLLEHREQAVAPFVSARAREPVESLLADRALSMSTFPHLEAEINRCIGPDGEVADAASPTLARLRVQIRTLRSRVREKLEAILRAAAAKNQVQENLVTMRNGRFVIPVKQEHRGAVPGIVHDQSGSGMTLFIEPMAVVELNNQLREVELDEAEEVERILRELTNLVAEDASLIRHTVSIAGEMDFIFARARLALEYDGVEPELNTEGWINIKQGRHPLLKGKAVPINVWLGKDFYSLVITGPNTGGKTVTLKTIGLFTLMAQAGLHVPAQPGSELAVVDAVYADIGDEQSIEQNLSTFSSHLSNIVRILQQATGNSLVLLDELGAGTDPQEGAALAMSILEFLLDVGCRTVATTHYSELKSFAYTQPGVENAGVEFDVETLQPTYRLSIGVAGSSNAFAIARRLGLSEAVLDRAKARLTNEEIKVEELLRTIELDRRSAVREREEAARLRAEMEQLRNRYEEAFRKLQGKRNELLLEATREADKLLTDARKEVEQLIGELRKAQHTEAAEMAQVARDIIVERQAHIREKKPEPIVSEPPRRKTSDEPIRKGDTVRIISLQKEAEALTSPDSNGYVQVLAGAMRLTLSVKDLEKVEKTKRERSVGYANIAREKSQYINTELDLRGLKVDEALERVDKYIDDCMLSGIPRARIIHGKGTGALRQAVREQLAGLPQVRRFRFGEAGEGGDGVTVVEFQ